MVAWLSGASKIELKKRPSTMKDRFSFCPAGLAHKVNLEVIKGCFIDEFGQFDLITIYGRFSDSSITGAAAFTVATIKHFLLNFAVGNRNFFTVFYAIELHWSLTSCLVVPVWLSQTEHKKHYNLTSQEEENAY
jgi:hypothetical protein